MFDKNVYKIKLLKIKFRSIGFRGSPQNFISNGICWNDSEYRIPLKHPDPLCCLCVCPDVKLGVHDVVARDHGVDGIFVQLNC